MEISSSVFYVKTDTTLTISNVSAKPTITDEEIPITLEPEDTTGQETIAKAPTATDTASDNNEAKGVLKLLQEGHFRGVADIRLRINFHDEISALQSEKADQTIRDGVSDIAETLTTEVNAFLENNTLDDELAGVISQASESMYRNFQFINENNTNDSNLQSSDIITRLQTTLDEFVSSVNINPETGIEPETPIVDEAELQSNIISTDEIKVTLSDSSDSSQTTISTPEILQQFLVSLKETFSLKLNSLETMLSEISILPEISEPNGNGKAYSKFLEIYNELYTTPNPTLQPELVDTLI